MGNNNHKVMITKQKKIAESGSRLINSPSTTGNPSGKGRGNNPSK